MSRLVSLRNRESGFTLLEIIVVLVILGLIASIVLTRGPTRSGRLELDAAARSLAGAFRLARSRAIAEDRMVIVVVATQSYRLDWGVPVVWSNHVFAPAARLISFTPDGGSSGGTVVLNGGNRKVVIAVDWLTGRLSLR